MFNKGQSGNVSGRPKGSKNKVNERVKESIELFLLDKLNSIDELYEDLSSKEKSRLLTKLVGFVVARPKEPMPEEEYEPITINIIKPSEAD